jgi:hypothetical protein
MFVSFVVCYGLDGLPAICNYAPAGSPDRAALCPKIGRSLGSVRENNLPKCTVPDSVHQLRAAGVPQDPVALVANQVVLLVHYLTDERKKQRFAIPVFNQDRFVVQLPAHHVGHVGTQPDVVHVAAGAVQCLRDDVGWQDKGGNGTGEQLFCCQVTDLTLKRVMAYVVVESIAMPN